MPPRWNTWARPFSVSVRDRYGDLSNETSAVSKVVPTNLADLPSPGPRGISHLLCEYLWAQLIQKEGTVLLHESGNDAVQTLKADVGDADVLGLRPRALDRYQPSIKQALVAVRE